MCSPWTNLTAFALKASNCRWFEIKSSQRQLGGWEDGNNTVFNSDLCELKPHSWSSFETLSLFVFFPSDSLPVPPEGRDHPVPAQAVQFSGHLCRWSGKKILIGGLEWTRIKFEMSTLPAAHQATLHACWNLYSSHSLTCFQFYFLYWRKLWMPSPYLIFSRQWEFCRHSEEVIDLGT